MYKIAVVGDYDSIFGFAALGLDTFAVQTREEAAGVAGVKKAVEQAVGSDIIFGS